MPSMPAQLPFAALNAALKAAGEATRLRMLALLGRSRTHGLRPHRDLAAVAAAHLAPSEAAGRSRPGRAFREGSWAFFRLGERGGGCRARARADRAARSRRPRSRATASGSPRCAPRARRAAQAYFRRHAAEWDRIRKLHVADDSGRGGDRCGARRPAVPLAARSRHRHRPHARTVRAARSSAGSASTCRSTCSRSRARGSTAPGLRHCSVRQGDIYDLALPKDSFDVVIIHQVLHFLDDGARAIARGRARAAPGRAAAGRRFRAARS